ncbi:MAG: hypothetical protein EBY96_04855, partial [Actinobacteria bacterium]|nr:hypothetical protein [Actinomycetota bacterium]
ILDRHEKDAEKVEGQYRRGIITDGERRQQEVRIWTEATAEVQKAMADEFKAQELNPIDMMISSGARGNITQMRQIAGMRGAISALVKLSLKRSTITPNSRFFSDSVM